MAKQQPSESMVLQTEAKKGIKLSRPGHDSIAQSARAGIAGFSLSD
ncbi:MAG: hypothetical protein VX430_02545 [Pseudomonadota bacterium]|nr:hypothetical protein [Pseudomonadota bacterium]